MLARKIKGFIGITRLDKPIGIYLLLWPALIALLVSTEISLNYSFVFIIVIGAILVRSTGCVINDIFDMDFDKKVDRTKHRPLASGQMTKGEAFLIFILDVLSLLSSRSAFALVHLVSTKLLMMSQSTWHSW